MIDKHIPIPLAANVTSGYASKYLWRECLAVGDSFIAGESDLRKVKYAMIKFCQRNAGYKFHAEVVADQKIRVWRTQ